MIKINKMLLLVAPLAIVLLVGCPAGVIELGCDWGCRRIGVDAGTGGVDAGTGGEGATGGDAGTGGAPLCAPGAVTSCYDGPAGTEGVGLCQAGTQTCAGDGASWGPCVGAVLPQVEDCGSGADQDCDGAVKTCVCGTTLWAARYGDGQIQGGGDVAVDLSGNVFLVGGFVGVLDFGGAPLTSVGLPTTFLVKLDANGQHLWSRAFAGCSGASLAVDAAGNLLVIGGITDPVDFGGGMLLPGAFVAKFDTSGNYVWGRSFIKANAVSIAVDVAASVFVTGAFLDSVDFGDGATSCNGPPCIGVFVVKFDAAGNHVWSRGFGDADLLATPYGQAIAVDASGNVLLSGSLVGSINFGGATLATDTASPACGAFGGCVGRFVAKLDAAGKHVWSRGFGLKDTRMEASVHHSLALDASGNALLAGSFNGSVDFGGSTLTSTGEQHVFAAKLDTDGNHVWSKGFGGDTHSGSVSIATDSAGNSFLAGRFTGSVGFGGSVLASAGSGLGSEDVFLAKFDAMGAHLCSKRFGDGDYQAPGGLAVDGAGNALVAGTMLGTIDFGSGQLTSAGSYDVFLAKFSP